MTDATLPPPDPGERLAADPESAVLHAAAAAVEPLAQQVEMTPLDFPRRVLFVHAHPDDETIATGATMAKYAADGALVTLVTCTRGEEGEIVVDDLRHLGSDQEDRLGEHRVMELAAACEALGVRDHRFLGGPGRYRDSGMMGRATNDDPRALWQADLDDATGLLVEVVREVRPQVIVTEDENGSYGHPDHIRGHQLAVAAFDAAGDPARYPAAGVPWQPAKLYYTAVSKSSLRQLAEYVRTAGIETPFGDGIESVDDVPFGVPDEQVTTVVDARDQLAAKVAALRAHRSQVAEGGMFFALAELPDRLWGAEEYVLARGERGPASAADGREGDLFAGVGAAGTP